MILISEGFIATLIICIILVIVVTIAIISIIKGKNKCGGGCGNCPYSENCVKNRK